MLGIGGAAGIFVFTAIVFVCYDLVSNRRQRLIKNRAVASANIVSSLFPKQVRTQLYEDNEARDSQFQAKSQLLDDNITPSELKASTKGRPNAQLYLNTTVFMADLVRTRNQQLFSFGLNY